jgi:hypothetical protein
MVNRIQLYLVGAFMDRELSLLLWDELQDYKLLISLERETGIEPAIFSLGR